MAMHIIIDGYNLLGIRGQMGKDLSRKTEQIREELIQELFLYQQHKKYQIIVVFDAWRERTSFEQCENRSGIKVIYTRGGERADQVIQRMAREYGRECLVVSSDLEILNTAKDHSALNMTSQEFQSKLQLTLRIGKTGIRPNSLRSSLVYGKVDDENLKRNSTKKGNPKKLPKSQRNRYRQLKEF